MNTWLNKFNQIYTGWKNHLLPPEDIKEFLNTLSEERLSLCRQCPFNSTPGDVKSSSRCYLCGCWLQAKSKCPECSCGAEEWNEKNPTLPQQEVRWLAVATEEQGTNIEEALNNEQSTQPED